MLQWIKHSTSVALLWHIRRAYTSTLLILPAKQLHPTPWRLNHAFPTQPQKPDFPHITYYIRTHAGNIKQMQLIVVADWQTSKPDCSLWELLFSSMSSTELRMMAEGKFASLPRNLHMSHQCTLASSMDLLSSGMTEVPSTSYRGISIHGTLPRKKKGGFAGHSRTWEMCGSLPHPTRCRLPSSPLIHNIIEENQPFQTWKEDCRVQRYQQHAATSNPSLLNYISYLSDIESQWIWLSVICVYVCKKYSWYLCGSNIRKRYSVRMIHYQ